MSQSAQFTCQQDTMTPEEFTLKHNPPFNPEYILCADVVPNTSVVHSTQDNVTVPSAPPISTPKRLTGQMGMVF